MKKIERPKDEQKRVKGGKNSFTVSNKNGLNFAKHPLDFVFYTFFPKIYLFQVN
jgi:hypothetical protein